MEIWRDIIGYEGLYQVSSDGRIKRLEFKKRNLLTGGFSTIRERILKPVKHYNGYLFVSLCNGEQKEFSIHTLVARAFIPNPENKPEVNHKNGVKSDNHISNLEWCTTSENILHAYENGLRPSGEKHHKSKLTLSQVNEIRELRKSGMTYKQLSKIYKIRDCSVRDIIIGKTWKYAV